MVKCFHLIEEVFDSEAFFAEVLHVDLSFCLVNEINTRRQDAHPSNTVHALDFLHHAVLGKLGVESGHSVLFDETLLDDAWLPKQLAQVQASFSAL